MENNNFNHYYMKYEKMIHYLLHRYNIKYAYDDYFQLMLIKLWELLQTFDELKANTMDKYIYTKLKFYLIDCIRKYSKETDRFIPTSDNIMLDQSYVEHYNCELYSMLEFLSPEELTWFNLTLQGFSTQEIAIYMNKSESTIKYYRKNARNKLKSHYLF
ncbi:sigma-70 family RNA polymerase sigma factor [Mammaliicoccus vitulinus]|uniref:sigma-70 family RNA polymerase sigma factor n=1 Tax=Mammaliicoccus vitulinus TaxID=71237 RepID=UPI002DB67323|nr:sigma-70 family RNA polymerase sigma factor [Mammaliicoccus vitulinus]MEB7658078.1 sigma-70 family RNA polymerase sigma factor [Mammaliicoccus vitulinus]